MELTPFVRLTVHQPGLTPQQLVLPAGVITLGRAHDCTVPIKDRFLSRQTLPEGRWDLRLTLAANGHIWRREEHLR